MCVNLYVHVEARGQPWVSPSVAANCVFETGSLMELTILKGRLASELQGPAVSTSLELGLQV